jgi:hypothetical protein
MNKFLYQSTSGRVEILRLYESILLTNGIFSRLDKKGFNTCYKRYRELGGRREFIFLGESN